jgi:hypothetical protein
VEGNEHRIRTANNVRSPSISKGVHLDFIRGILTLFQIEDASNSPTTRTTALISLICSLMSLLYGGTYILRFGTMRGMDKAVRWAEVRMGSLSQLSQEFISFD